LKVGPMSQGSSPGPACYGRGGIEPTVTDADVILGYINPDYFLGGEMPLDGALSHQALKRRICEPIGLSLEEAAWGAYEIVNSHMADLIRQASVERGHDPRDFVLVAFGGCGPTHCTGYGPDIGAKKIIVPLTAPVFSALGIAQSDIKHFYSRSLLIRMRGNAPLADGELDDVNATLADLMERARRQFAKEGVAADTVVLHPSFDMRFRGQVHELMIPVDPVMSHAAIERARGNFLVAYERNYGSGASSKLSDIEIVSVRVDAIAPTIAQISSLGVGGLEKRRDPIGERRVYCGHTDKWRMTPIYRGEALAPGSTVSGPAVLEYYATTIPLHPGQTASVDQHLNLMITAGA
jgi:N-methylhydantoinase A